MLPTSAPVLRGRDRVMTHIDLFTGIGGFTLAAHANGYQTVVMCEADKRRRAFLERAWPGIPIHDDVRTFDGTKWTGAALLTGGVPCQPASRAGKQRGKEDDRWLWGETLRVVAEAQPRWCLFENPPGIGDVGLDGILADLETLGYEIGLADIPACAVNSPQLRHRYWIVAHRNEAGCCQQGWTEPAQEEHRAAECCGQGHLADTGSGDSEQRRTIGHEETQSTGAWAIDEGLLAWERFVWLPCADGKVRRAPDDSFDVADGLHRSVLAALGDSIVPQVAYEVIRAIRMADRGVTGTVGTQPGVPRSEEKR